MWQVRVHDDDIARIRLVLSDHVAATIEPDPTDPMFYVGYVLDTNKLYGPLHDNQPFELMARIEKIVYGD